MSAPLPVLRNFIGGAFVDPGALSAVVDPATGQAYARAPVSGPAEVDAAMGAAGAAFETWRDVTPSVRQRALLKMADAVEERADELVQAECRNTGKPVALTMREELAPLIDELRFFAGAARVLEGSSAGEYLTDHTSWVGAVWVNTHIPFAPRCPMAVSATRVTARTCPCTGSRSTRGSSTS